MTVRRSHVLILLILGQAVLAWSLSQGIVVPALPEMVRRLHTDSASINWVFTSYLVAASVFTPLLGRIGDMVGQRRVLIGTLVAFTLGCVLGALATNLGVMVVSRVLQGAAGGLMPLSFSILRVSVPRAKVAGAIGLIAGMSAASVGVGLVFSGPVLVHLGYHWLFWIPMLLAGAALVGSVLVLPEVNERTPAKVNVGAALLLSGGLVAFLLDVSEGERWGWTSTRTVVLFVVAAVLAAGWIRVELRAAEPLIDMRMMRARAIWTSNASAAFIGIAVFGATAAVPIFLETPKSTGYGFGASVSTASLLLFPQAATMFIACTNAGALTRWFGSRALLISGCFIQAAALLLLSQAHHQQWEVIVAMAVSGLGFGMSYAALPALIVAAVPPSQTGVASGMNANLRTIGGSVGTALVAAIMASQVTRAHVPSEHAYTLSFLVLSAATVVAGLVAFGVPRVIQPGVEPLRDHDGRVIAHAELAMVPAGTVVDDEQ